MRWNLIDQNQIFPMISSEFRICLSVLSRYKKPAEKRIVSKMSMISIPNLNIQFKTWIMIVLKFYVNGFNMFIEISRQRASWSGQVILEKDPGHTNKKIDF